MNLVAVKEICVLGQVVERECCVCGLRKEAVKEEIRMDGNLPCYFYFCVDHAYIAGTNEPVYQRCNNCGVSREIRIWRKCQNCDCSIILPLGGTPLDLHGPQKTPARVDAAALVKEAKREQTGKVEFGRHEDNSKLPRGGFF